MAQVAVGSGLDAMGSLIPQWRIRFFGLGWLAWICFVAFVQPCWDITLAMQYTPDVDVAGQIDVEDEIRIALQGPRTQVRQIQFMSVAWRANGRLAGDLEIGLLHRPNETERNLLACFAQVVIDRILDIPAG